MKIAFNVSRAFVSVLGVGLVSLLCAECSLRLFESIKGDPISSLRLPRNQKYEFLLPATQKLESRVVHTKNSLGFRGPDLPMGSRPRHSVLAVGGSTTECRLLSDGRDWPILLGHNLETRGVKGLWVNNAGLDGHSTFGHAVLLSQYIVKLRPEYILFLIGKNDVNREDLNVGYDNTLLAMQADPSPWRLLRFLRFLQTRLRLRPQSVPNVEIDFLARRHLDLESKEYNLRQLIERNAHDLVPRFAQRVRALVSSCKKNMIIPVLLTQPSLYGRGVDPSTGVVLDSLDASDTFGSAIHDRINGATAGQLLEMYNAATRQVAIEERVPLFDLSAQMPKDSRYFYDFCHFSNEGSEFVATLVADALFRLVNVSSLSVGGT